VIGQKALYQVPGEPFLFQRGGGACILEIFAEKRVSNHPDLLLIGQACRAAQPPPIFELVRNSLVHTPVTLVKGRFTTRFSMNFSRTRCYLKTYRIYNCLSATSEYAPGSSGLFYKKKTNSTPNAKI
jgi:hypothetical protein